MNQPSRPALKITRRAGPEQANNFVYEVWSPFIGSYQPVASIEAGLQRIDRLVRLIQHMTLQQHPKQELLTDVPDAEQSDSTVWAEFRVSPTTYRSFDTRRNDRPRWVHAISMLQAAETICAGVGCPLPIRRAS